MMLNDLGTHIRTIVIDQMVMVNVVVIASITVKIMVVVEEEEINQRVKYMENMGILH